jgi:hypothetical protein
MAALARTDAHRCDRILWFDVAAGPESGETDSGLRDDLMSRLSVIEGKIARPRRSS